MTTEAPKITRLVPWFGAKADMAARIVALCCEGKRPAWFAEPFCGSMAVSLAMPRIPTHVVNDKHQHLTMLAQTLAVPRGRELLDRLNRTLCSESVAQHAAATVAQAQHELGARHWSAMPMKWRLEQCWAFFVCSWLGANGLVGTTKATGASGRFPVRFAGGGGDPATRLRSAVESLGCVGGHIEKLRRFTITNRDGFEIIENAHDRPDSCLYIDPPYLEKTAEYEHDFETNPHEGGGLYGDLVGADDHARLARALARFEHARVVVSYYAHPRLEELYPTNKWTHIDCATVKKQANAVMKGADSCGNTSPEVLLVNRVGPEPAAGGAV